MTAAESGVQPAGEQLLDVEHLKVSFQTEEGVVQAVDDVSFKLSRGELVGIVGESGSGKSVTAMTLMGLTRGPNASFSGQVSLQGFDLLSATENDLRRIRGKRIAMIFQDPMTALNPVHRVGEQIVEQIRAHEPISKAAARARAVDLLDRVGIPRAAERARSFPHEFSGGMRQRVMIAMALSCSPEILIADEPTTALDVTIQAQILAEIETLREETGVGVLLITHDLGVIADVADRVIVMYAGRVVEQGGLDEIFYDPLHPYTWGLLGSVPRVDKDRPGRLPTIPGAPPSLLHPPEGCHFAPRCPWRFDECDKVPALGCADWDAPDHLDRCWLDLEDKRTRRYVSGDAIGLPARAPADRAAAPSPAEAPTPPEGQPAITAIEDHPTPASDQGPVPDDPTSGSSGTPS
jgi:peptide/nickel transport system ATP-binding protein